MGMKKHFVFCLMLLLVAVFAAGCGGKKNTNEEMIKACIEGLSAAKGEEHLAYYDITALEEINKCSFVDYSQGIRNRIISQKSVDKYTISNIREKDGIILATVWAKMAGTEQTEELAFKKQKDKVKILGSGSILTECTPYKITTDMHGVQAEVKMGRTNDGTTVMNLFVKSVNGQFYSLGWAKREVKAELITDRGTYFPEAQETNLQMLTVKTAPGQIMMYFKGVQGVPKKFIVHSATLLGDDQLPANYGREFRDYTFAFEN